MPLTKALVFALLLLPAGCLLWKWSALPAQIPLHFGRGGADAFGDKHVLLALVVLPLALYAATPWLYRSPARAASYRPLLTGAAVALSLVLTTLIIASPAAG